MAFCPLSETTSIPTPFMRDSPPRGYFTLWIGSTCLHLTPLLGQNIVLVSFIVKSRNFVISTDQNHFIFRQSGSVACDFKTLGAGHLAKKTKVKLNKVSCKHSHETGCVTKSTPAWRKQKKHGKFAFTFNNLKPVFDPSIEGEAPSSTPPIRIRYLWKDVSCVR